MPPVRPEDAPPIPDPARSQPSEPLPRRRDGSATELVHGERACSSSGAKGLGLAAAVAAAGALVAGVAGVAAARRLGRDTPPLYRSLRATPREWWWSGFRLVYYETGPVGTTAGGDGSAAPEPLVLVHSIHAAASAWEMRELFTRLGTERRVFALDLLGFGASERPDIDYDSDLYQDLLRDFVREVVGEPAHVLASSVSASHALEAAAADASLFRSLVLVNPTGLLTQATGPDGRGRLLQNLFRLPFVGEALYNLLVSRPSLAYYGSRIYRDPAVEEENAEQQYLTAHQPGARYAPAAFLGSALGKNVYMALRTVEVPALSIWSGGDIVDTKRESEAYAAVAPGMRQVWIEDAGSVPHEERPDEVATAVTGWLAERRA